MTVRRLLLVALGLLLAAHQARAEDPAHRQVLLLHSYHAGYSWTDDLQRGIASVLGSMQISFEREFRLDEHSRIDFMVEGGIGIEAKINGTSRDTWKQCVRYMEFSAVEELILVTVKSRHRDGRLTGKPFHIAWLSAQSL